MQIRSRALGAIQIVIGVAAILVIALSSCDKDSPMKPQITAFDAQIVGAEVRLTWSLTSNVERVRLLRRLNVLPRDAEDDSADVLFEGDGESFLDSLAALLPSTAATPRTYHYALFPCIGTFDCLEESGRDSIEATVLQCLRAGGYSIWWRHASATVCADRLELGTAATTTVPDWWKSCDPNCPVSGGGTATARQLSDIGVMEATVIGNSIDLLSIPIGRVISSEYCRCVHTAELNDFGPAIEQDSSITFFVYDEANRCAHSQERIAELPPAGSNTAIIGQAGFTGSCPVLGELAWGEAAIYKPKGDGTAELITRVPFDQWPSVATAPPRAARASKHWRAARH